VLLARVGVNVAVLEQHDDFLRDFRGDTIHPSTMNVMNWAGWRNSSNCRITRCGNSMASSATSACV
jgi:2-polyprenyl-6-methoxyphenol hydroxylase-like FAD-dependent oxidoreductase